MISTRWRGYAILCGAFLLGGLAGAGLMYAACQKSLATLAEDRAEAKDMRRLNAFTRELELSAPQRESVRQIVDNYRPERERRARDMFDGCGKPLKELRSAMDAEIRGVLNPEQQKRFDTLRERRRKLLQRD